VSRRFLLLSLLPLLTLSCGYHVGGKGDLIPKSIQTLSIPSFSTNTTQYRLPDMLANQIGREFTARTRFTVVKDPSTADAVLNGTISSVVTYPTVSDPSSGKSTIVQMIATLNVKLVQRATGRVLYSRPNFVVRSYYQIASDPHQYFDEAGPAYTRLSQTVAQDVVSSVMDNF
jgi:outer membrane lipopolysaccharide assembly protein LptE/RlpB